MDEMRTSTWALALTLLLLAPRLGHAQCRTAGTLTNLNDSAAFLWDVDTNGSIYNGSIDSYDSGLELVVDGTVFPAGTPTTELGGRQVVLGPATLSGLSVTRRVYVPTTEAWARFLDTFTNSTAAPITATVIVQSNYGSDSGTAILASSSGDMTLSSADRWVTTDDATDSGADPSLCHVMYGTGAAVAPATITNAAFSCFGTEGMSVTYTLTVPAGGTVRLLYFESQNMNRAGALVSCMSFDTLAASTTSDIPAAELATVVNWTFAQPNGAACTVAAGCVSGNCVDGVCCDTACGGGAADCQTCAIAAGAAADGTCGTIAAGTECRAAADQCDVAEACDGTATECPADAFAAAGTECRAAANACDVAEACDGAASTCPADVLATDGTACEDGMSCNGAETCMSGTCMMGTTLDCDDGDVCTADSCAEPGGCANTPIADCCIDASDCDDLDPCTTDTCGASMLCEHAPIAGCGGTDAGPSTDGGGTGSDGGVGADGGPRPPTRGGCGCAVPSEPDGSPALLLLVVAGLLLRRRRARK